jgi:hypothetical protein
MKRSDRYPNAWAAQKILRNMFFCDSKSKKDANRISSYALDADSFAGGDPDIIQDDGERGLRERDPRFGVRNRTPVKSMTRHRFHH